MKEAHNHKRTTPGGRALGRRIAAIAHRECTRLNGEGEPDERCTSCAFRTGTVPNGCHQTQLDALKAIVENVPFLCHQHGRRGQICHGWYAVRTAVTRAEAAKGPMPINEVPWDFSPPDKEDASGNR